MSTWIKWIEIRDHLVKVGYELSGGGKRSVSCFLTIRKWCICLEVRMVNMGIIMGTRKN